MIDRFPRVAVATPLCASFFFATLTATSSSCADDTDKARAVQLFMDGKQLMEKGKYPEACPKLEESLRLVPADGTLLRYAWCEEMIGKFATAWALFNQGLSLAKTANNEERIKFASEHIASIEPKLSKVMIHVPAAAKIDGLEVRWDGKIVGSGAWDSEFPVDPGNHSLSATAPGRQLWTTTIGVGINADRRTVDVPQLTTSSDVGVKASPESVEKHTPVLAYVLGGTGVLLIGGAVVAHFVAVGAQNDRQAHCSSVASYTCDDDYNLSKMHQWETMSYLSLGLGVASLGVGVALYVTSKPSSKSSGSTHVTTLAAGSVAGAPGLNVLGSF